MANQYQLVVCAGIVPDPLQTLEPVGGGEAPALKNETMLPAVLDPWAASALYEAAALAGKNPGSKIWLVSMAPKAKLQQVMMAVAQKVPFELVAVDGPMGGFTESSSVADLLAEAIKGIAGLDMTKVLLFGGWESAARGMGTTLQAVGELLGIRDQFQGVDEVEVNADGTMKILERIEGGKHQVSALQSPPAVFGWATGKLAEPPNNPQVGMQNMRTIMPALQKAKPGKPDLKGLKFLSAALPTVKRETRVVKDVPLDDMAKELAAWVKGGN